MSQRFVIIDGNALVHRAFHAIPPMTNKNGQVLNAVYGFTSIFLKAIKDLKPVYLAVTFDLAAPTFRHKEYKEYKAKRVKQPQELYDQLYLIKDLLRAMKIKIYEREGFEADDVIATLAQTSLKTENVILTGDMDTLQLINNNTKIYSLHKGISDIFVYDDAAVKERYGLLPSQMIDYKALRGDPSDNILGVKGIGEKTATDLIQKFGSIEEMYKKIKDPKNKIPVSAAIKEKLLKGEKEAIQSKHLVELVRDAPIDFKLEDCKMADYNNPAARDLLAGWEFGSLIKRFDGQETSFKKSETDKTKTQNSKLKVIEIKDKEGAEKLKKDLFKTKQAAFYLSDDGQAGGLKAKLFGLAVTLDGKTVYYLPAQQVTSYKLQVTRMVGHDLKRTLEILKCHGWEVSGDLSDVMLMDYLLDPGGRSHDLPSLVLRYLGTPLKESPQTGLFGENPQDLAQKLLSLWAVEAKLRQELAEKGFIGLYKKIDEPLVEPLMRMEEAGVKIDEKYLNVLAKKLSKKEEELRKKIFELAGQEFNIASPQQLKEILFEKLKISTAGIRKGKTGLSTAASELEKMRGEHPVIELIFDYREIAKLRNTYVDVLPNLLDKKTGRVHTTFNQAVTATGRLSSSDPNLQNIPIRTELGNEIRKCFIAEEGYKLLSADYSQIELRIVASLANDKEMIGVFNRHEDIHTTTAAKINGVPIEAVTKEMRRAAKAVNFGIIYGIGPQGLSEGAGISFAEAKDFIRKYLEVFSGVKEYMETTRALAHSQGFVETLLGRRRYLPEINSGMFQLRNAAERMAINAPVQGTAADLIKLAMIEINQMIKTKYNPEDVKMILQVHDELVFDVKNSLAESFGQEVKLIMENVIKLRVPVLVELESGQNWGELKQI